MLHVLLKNFILLPAFDAVIILDNIEIFILLKLLIQIYMKHLLHLLLVLTLGLLILSAYKIADTPDVKINNVQKELIDLIFNGTGKILKGIVESPIEYTNEEYACGVISLPDNVDEREIINYTYELINIVDSVIVQTTAWNRITLDDNTAIRSDYKILHVNVQFLYIKTNDRNDLLFIVSNL